MTDRTLADRTGHDGIILRITGLSADDRAAWGTMSVHQMVCHLADGYRLPLGEKAADTVSSPLPRPIIKWIALRVPIKWGKGFPTPPEMEQGKGGSRPIEFEQDKEALLTLLRRFCDDLPQPCVPHPVFGEMNASDWRRWGYLHADHHLRQFGR